MVGVPEPGGVKNQLGKELHRVATAGDADEVAKLLGRGAPADAKDENGYNALQKSSCEGHTSVVKQLLKSGSGVDHQDSLHGNTALHEAAWKGYSQTAELLVKAKANVYIKNKGGFAPLHLACQNGHNQSCRVLLLAGCHPDIKNNYGDTPLHTSARYGHAGVTRILLSARANVKEVNKNGDTTLHIAAAMGRRKLTRILLESGADQSIKNKQGETPFEIAQRKDFTQILEILRNPPPIVTPEERLLQEQEQKMKDAKGKDKKSKKREKTNDSGTSSKESGSRPKEKKKLKGDSKLDPQTKTARLSSYGVEWSPYGCPYSSTIADFLVPNLESLPPKPLRTGEQYFVDLAGNIKKGPVGVGSACYCAPLFKTVQNRMEKDKIDLMDHIDAAHTKLGKRISSLESHTKNHIQKLGDTVHQKLATEREECRQRSERLKINREEDVNKKVEELQKWVETKLTNHHPDSPTTFRGRTFATRKPSTVRVRDPVTGLLALTRSQSEEAVSEIRDEEEAEPVYKGLRVLDHPTSMYNIPQSIKVEGDAFIYDFPKPSSNLSSSADRSHSADSRIKYSEVEMCVPSLTDKSEDKSSTENHSYPRRRSSSEDPRNVPRFLDNLPIISESRRRDPLPPNTPFNSEFCVGDHCPFPTSCPAVSAELDQAVGKLRVYDGETRLHPPENGVSVPRGHKAAPDYPFSKYHFRNANPYMENLRNGQHPPAESFLSPFTQIPPEHDRKLPYDTSSYSRNAQTYHATVVSAPEESEAATYVDMDRYRIQAAVRHLYDGYSTADGRGVGNKTSRSLLESSTEHDSHNDSGYSTRLCTASQGPSPALSGFHDSQEAVAFNPSRLTGDGAGPHQYGSPHGATPYMAQGQPHTMHSYNGGLLRRATIPPDGPHLGIQGDARFIPPNLKPMNPGLPNGYGGNPPGLKHAPIPLKEPSLV